jgi:hypothetical protein
MKRRGSFLMSLVSCELSLVSARFTFRFTHPLASAKSPQIDGEQYFSVRVFPYL